MTKTQTPSAAFNQQIRLRPGLDARELEMELVFNNRACDMSKRALAFYLDDMNFRGLHQALGYPSASSYAQQRLAMGRRTARTYLMVGKALRDLPLIDEAFCEERINWSKVRSLVAIATEANESEWLAHAEKVTSNQLELDLKGTEKGRPPRSNSKGTPSACFQFGTKLGTLDFESLQQVRRMICDEAGVELDDAEILNTLVSYRLRKGAEFHGEVKTSRSRYQVSVGKCSECAKTSVHTENGAVELTAKEAALVACDGEHLSQHVCGQSSETLTGSTPPPMRKRVLARDGNRCVHCGNSDELHAHHIVFRSNDGPTEESNLTTLCHRCHGLVHDEFLFVEGIAPYEVSISDRDGNNLAGALPHSGIKMSTSFLRSGPQGPLGPTPASGEKLSDLIGQQVVIQSLSTACRAAKIQKRPVRHTLLSGPPGLGKTTMARAVAVESRAPFVERNGPSVASIEELEVQPGSILFIDEIHGLSRPIAEQLYAVMDLKKVCVIGATTNPDLMPKPLLDRFTLKEELLNYSVADLATLVRRASRGVATKAAAIVIANASLGVPRRALGLLAVIEDQHIVSGNELLSAEFARSTLKQRRLTPNGLGPRHLETLNLLRTKRRPIGLARLAGTIGLDSQVFQNTVEPELLKLGLIEVTPAGLVAV